MIDSLILIAFGISSTLSQVYLGYIQEEQTSQAVHDLVEYHLVSQSLAQNQQLNQLPTPTKTPTPVSSNSPTQTQPEPPTENYLLESHPSGEEGFYVLKNAQPEEMATPAEIDAAVNQYRRGHNLNQLSIDDQICIIAQDRAREAAEEFSHDKFGEHVSNGDYSFANFSRLGENLWQGSMSGVHIVEFGWDRSPGHRANLQGNWSRGCAGVFETTVAYIFAD